MPTHITTEQAKAAEKRRLADALRANLRRRKTAASRPAEDPMSSEQPPNRHDRRSGDDLNKG